MVTADEPRDATKAELTALRDLREARGRREQGACLVEGERALTAALDAGAAPALLAVEPRLVDTAIIARAERAGARVVVAPADRLARVSDREAAPGLAAAVAIPAAWSPTPAPPGASDLVLGLCGLQDPGNVGTLVRSARAFAARAVVVAPGTADPWGPKVVRSTAGAVFGIDVARVDGDDEAEQIAAWQRLAETLDVEIVAAAAHAPGDAAVDDLPRRCLLLLGHETRGVPEGAGRAVTIRHEPDVESLNVAMAGSILMARWYGARRAS